jgi:multidrug resistance efflux pump
MMLGRWTALATLAVSTGACAKERAPIAGPTTRSYVAVARGRVDVEGGMLEIVSPRQGTVVEVRVREGERVEEGAVLLRFDPRLDEQALAVARAEVDLARAQADVLNTRLASASERGRNLEAAAAEGAISGSDVDGVRAEIARLRAEEAAANAAVELALRRLDAAQVTLDTAVLHAPAAGRIVRCGVRTGAFVAIDPSVVLFELLPDTPRIVRAWVSDTFAGKVAVGMHANVAPEADPAEDHSAHVVRIGAVSRPAEPGAASAEPTFGYYVECILALDDSGADLRVGQPVLVRIR